jgi:SMI1/KNR4 family protein SUKH-1
MVNRLTSLTVLAVVIALIGACRKMKSDFAMPPGATAPWPPATEQELEDIETKLGVRLPPEYRQFLAEINGLNSGYPILAVSHYNDRAHCEDFYDLCVLYTVSPSSHTEARLLECQDDYGFSKRVPKRFMIIGRSFGEDQFCISLSGHDRGWVYHWYKLDAEPEQWETNSEEFLTPLAKSFNTFWSRIVAPPESHWK